MQRESFKLLINMTIEYFSSDGVSKSKAPVDSKNKMYQHHI